jgi:hypothetical protein
MKKALKIVVSVVVILVVVVVVVVFFALNRIIKTGVETAVPKLTQSPVKLEKVLIRPLTGTGLIAGLAVGNPEGFKTPNAVTLGALKIDLDTRSVFSDRVVIRDITVEAPEITYEMGLKGSNLSKIQKNVEAAAGPKEDKKPEKPKEGKPGKKIQIDNLVITGGKIRVSAPMLAGKTVAVPLPKIQLKDIGKESEASMADVVSIVLGEILKVSTKAVAESGALLGDGVKLLGDAAGKGIEGAAGVAAKGLEAVTDVAGEGVGAKAGAAIQGVKGAGGVATDGTKAVTDAAGKGVSALTGGVKGIFGRKPKKPEPEEAAE